MKAKTIVGWTEKTFDKKLNAFLSNTSLEIIDVKFSSPIFFYSALILYK
ncbi:hypothetical protein [Bacillus thermotolerans]|uniref:Uncharacterized protein n=1 Tax=Bacillus thermotolerans TaxID=1221996 RepID=A0A0F5I5J3_BACTR|nr:hypothetical protein [Bacillus thermotolerans]KKB35475.1 hypothetical protein QY97_01653 [Bacillus thermotolerans]KKB40929.1 hypothetical protein QY95_00992 [Bacillus thermotolerans]KKB45004.1 hypothetical protein QY96_00128 [Bacillus thermotolerans]